MKKLTRTTVILLLTAMISGCAAAPAPSPAPAPGGSSAVTEPENAPNAPTPAEADYHLANVAYPDTGDYGGMDAQTFSESDAHWKWWEAYHENLEASWAIQDGLGAFNQTIINELLITEETDNRVCSPINLYIALAMLAECTDADSRAQILDVLGEKDIDCLRANAKILWEANYVDTPILQSLLGSSVWIKKDVACNHDTLQVLADNYYTEPFYMEPGVSGYDTMLQTWMDNHTGGMLTDSIRDIRFRPETVLALVSTIYYKAAWLDKFQAEATTTEVFHGAEGDTDVDMMHRSDMTGYFKGANFGAISLPLNDSGSMYLFLPDEGTDVKEVVANEETLDLMRGTADTSTNLVHLSLPKFKAGSDINLMDSMKQLGITNVMIPEVADFTPIITDENLEPLYLSDAKHAAIVDVDEEGVTGAAYTIMMVAEGAALMEPEEIDFILDRPFYFTVTSRDGSILFAGIVQNP